MPKTARRPRGDGTLHQRSRDGMWVASIELPPGPDGRRRRKTATARDYATAVRRLRDLRRAAEQSGGDLPTTALTVEQWLTHWLDDIAAAHLKPTSLAGYRSAVQHQLVPHLGRRRLDKLTPQHVRAMHRALAESGLSASSALKAHRVLAKALTDAMREGLVVRNVATLVDAPRRTDSDRHGLTAPQAKTLLRHVADDPLAARWATALLLGARQGECLGLEWDRVDLDAWVVDVSWQLQRLPYRHGCGGRCGRTRAAYCPSRVLDVRPGFTHRPIPGSGLVLTRPKGRPRVLPLPAPLAAVLDRHHALAGRPATGLVWTTPTGDAIDPRRDYEAWRAHLRAAGLPDVPLHAARHTTATLLMEAGVPDTVIQAILGHSDVVTTRGYQRADLTVARSALDALGASLLAQQPGDQDVPQVGR